LVAVEAVFAVAALGAAAVLVTQPPGRQVAAAQAAQRPVSGTADIGHDTTATITVRPRRHGAVSISVDLRGGTPAGLTLTAEQTEVGIGPIPITLQDGTATGVGLAAAGPWRFQVRAAWSQFDVVVSQVVIRLA
jgi:hypothetical protein